MLDKNNDYVFLTDHSAGTLCDAVGGVFFCTSLCLVLKTEKCLTTMTIHVSNLLQEASQLRMYKL